ncbi:dihydrofolate reductase family protein [Nocardioides lentus]|uniref:Dihydrofolate reductase family protein n=1 Tax=Nocardioides lentus TaxID=338077 RepID=A0ABP5AS01_9ACTN
MTVRTTYYTAASLDGFVADPQDSLAWLFAQHHENPADASLTYDALLARTGAVLMGATTYLWIRGHVVDSGEGWPYDLPTWVMTHHERAGVDGADVRFASGDVAAVHADVVASAAGRDVWVVGGGDLAGQLADAGLLDDVVVSLAPVVLGAGRPLLPRRLQLRLAEHGTAGDLLTARYDVVGPRPGVDWTA